MAVKPLENMFSSLLGGGRKTRVRPVDTLGTSGTAVFGGYVVENEEDGRLSDRERFRTYSEILANTSIVSAGVRYFLNLISKASWTFEPSESDTDGKFSQLAEECLTEDPSTTWARVVRRAAMYRFYGFSIQEWTAKRREDGVLTFANISPRAQITIERWDINTDGSINGVVQRNPQDQSEIYLPRNKIIYFVDDTLNDSPLGLGIFRHLVDPVKRLKVYEKLEGFGYEADLRGIPIGKAPYEELRKMVEAGTMTVAEALKAVAPVESFVKKHIRKPDLGLLIDSQPYVSTDEATSPSSTSKYGVDLLDGGSNSLPDIHNSITRLNKEIARVLGVESILLGDGAAGSHALSRDKTNQFSLVIDATLSELAEGFADDLLNMLWTLNGWPEEMKPKLKPEAVQYRDVQDITAALRDMAQAGAILEIDDPAINDVRALLGVSPVDFLNIDMDAAIGSTSTSSSKENEEQMPGEDDK